MYNCLITRKEVLWLNIRRDYALGDVVITFRRVTSTWQISDRSYKRPSDASIKRAIAVLASKHETSI